MSWKNLDMNKLFLLNVVKQVFKVVNNVCSNYATQVYWYLSHNHSILRVNNCKAFCKTFQQNKQTVAPLGSHKWKGM